jgi:hypothetical protein
VNPRSIAAEAEPTITRKSRSRQIVSGLEEGWLNTKIVVCAVPRFKSECCSDVRDESGFRPVGKKSSLFL